MDAILEIGQYARPRFGLVLFSVFAAVGLVLVTIGVYSVVSWTVTQQRHEIVIRMALGASVGDVRSLVLTGTLRFVLMGVAAGLALAWVVGRVLASQLWGVAGYDPVTLCGVIAVLTAVGLAAAYVPSVRATRVDPAVPALGLTSLWRRPIARWATSQSSTFGASSRNFVMRWLRVVADTLLWVTGLCCRCSPHWLRKPFLPPAFTTLPTGT